MGLHFNANIMQDSLIAKVMVYSVDRTSAIDKMQVALNAVRLRGLVTNLHLIRGIFSSDSRCELRFYFALHVLMTTSFLEGQHIDQFPLV